MGTIKELICGDSAVRTIVDDNNVEWFVGNDVSKLLGYSNYRNAVAKHVEEEDKILHTMKSDGQRRTLTCINSNGVMSLVIKSRLPNAINYAKSLGISVLRSTKEQETMNVLLASFSNYNPKTQYKVGNYRVDLYLSDSNIAIECDELGHRGYCEVDEAIRQGYIEQELGCTFVRFNPDSENFNVGDVICEVLQLIDVKKSE